MSTWAVIKTGGKQYKVSEGEVLAVEKLKNASDAVTFNEVLALAADGQIKLGKPYVESTSVKAKIQRNYKDKKVRVVKFRAKSRYHRVAGARQEKTEILIEKILYKS